MNFEHPVRQVALAYVQSGLSVVPIKADGTKQPPPLSWKWLQEKRPSPYQITQIFRGEVGIAIIGGKVSGGLEIIDFDRSSLIVPWVKIIQERAPGLVERLSWVTTPKGGAHFYYRCSEIGHNEKLAQDPPGIDEATGDPKPQTLIETRGEGGYVLAPGSPPACHPTGRTYDHVSGPKLTEISTISPEERQILLDAARSFNQWTPVVHTHSEPGRVRQPGDPLRPGDDFNRRATWDEILTPAGWKPIKHIGESTHWRRPGKQDGGTSATSGHCGDNFFVFSSNASPFQPNTAYTKFAAYATLHHGGDFLRAAKDLAERGYGDANDPVKVAQNEKDFAEFEEAFEKAKVAKKGKEAPEEPPHEGGLPAIPQKDPPPAPPESAAPAAPPKAEEGAPAAEVKPPYKKRDERHSGNVARYFEGKEFLPWILAKELCEEHEIIATPIGDDHKGVTMYVYKDGVFRSRLGETIETAARKALGDDAKPERINQVLDLIHRSQKIDYERVNPLACDLINVRNGMLNWRTGELLPHDPKYLSTIQLSVEYDPHARCEALDKFFNDVFPQDCVALAEEFAGYLMIPDASLQKAFIAVGSGGNGKGTFLKLLTHMLGRENISTLDIHTLEEDKFAVATLIGKLANIHHDLSRKQLESTSRFKTLVSGDPISGEKKYKDGFTFQPYARLVFSANEFPRSEDKTNAYFRRLIFVEFQNTFADTQKEILKFDQVLAATPGFMPALLNRALSGLRRVMERGKFTISQTSIKTIEQYKRECNSAYDFVQEFCHFEEWGWIPRSEMYTKYVGWCEDNGLKPMSSKNFVNAIRDTSGVKETKREGVRGWAGISWQNGAPPRTAADEIAGFGAPIPGRQSDDF